MKMMKVLGFFTFLVGLCFVGIVEAGPALIFSGVGGGTAWTATKTAADTVEIDFYNIWVDSVDPADTTMNILHDIIDIPTLTFTKTGSETITVAPGITLTTYYGSLTPLDGAKFAIKDNLTGAVKLDADMEVNGLFAFAASYGAYTNETSDLTHLVNKDPGYSDTIDLLTTAAAGGMAIDMSITGEALGKPTFFELLDSGDIGDMATGNLSGQIKAIPEPASICLLGFGALALLRRKK